MVHRLWDIAVSFILVSGINLYCLPASLILHVYLNLLLVIKFPVFCPCVILVSMVNVKVVVI